MMFELEAAALIRGHIQQTVSVVFFIVLSHLHSFVVTNREKEATGGAFSDRSRLCNDPVRCVWRCGLSTHLQMQMKSLCSLVAAPLGDIESLSQKLTLPQLSCRRELSSLFSFFLYFLQPLQPHCCSSVQLPTLK